jgi:hypothetical protein
VRIAPHLRALFVALHLALVTFTAMPSVGGGMNRQAWKQPTVQGEFRAWSERLGGWGLDLPPDELEERAWTFAVAYEKGRGRVLDPFRWYFEVCGVWQSWKMFVAPHRFPARLEIEIRRAPADGAAARGGPWEVVYAARSDEHEWMREWLDHDRFRAAVFRYAWDHYKVTRRQFADWVAKRATVDFPDASQVRVSFVRYRTASPEEVRAGVAPTEKRELVETRDLGAPR